MDDAKLEKLIKPLIKIYDDIELELIKDIAIRLNTYSGVNGSLKWYLDKLQAMGGFNRESLELLAEFSNKSQHEVKRILKYAGYNLTGFDRYKEYYDDGYLKENPLSLYENIAIKRTINNAINETESVMETIRTKALESAKQNYMKILTESYTKVSSGIYTYDQAIRQGLKELAEHGFTTATYESGRTLSLESTVRRDVLTKVRQLAGSIELENAKQLGTNLVYVTQHLGARIRTKYTKEDYEAHVEWQGKVYMIEGSNDKYDNFYEKTGYGEMLGLKGINCRHHFYPTFEWEKHPERINPEENEKAYIKQQEQRGYERRMRSLKRKKVVAETLEDKDELKKINNKIKSFNTEYDKFLKQNNLRRDYSREFIEKGLVKIDDNKKISKLGSSFNPDSFVKPHDEMKIIDKIDKIDENSAINYLKNYEEKIRNSDIENAVMILDDGTCCQSFGVKDNLYPYHDLQNNQLLKDRTILYMTHNHPKDETSFSFDGDDRDLWDNNEDLLILRHTDYKYTSQFSRIDKTVDKSSTYEDLFDIPFEMVQHEINIGRAKEFNYGYTRTKNDI